MMVEAFPDLMGLDLTDPRSATSTFGKIKLILGAFPTAHGPTIALGFGSLVFLAGLKYLKQRLTHKINWLVHLQESVILIMIAIILSRLFDFAGRGIEILGPLDDYLPAPHIPEISFELINRLLSDVITIGIVGFVDTQSITRHLGLVHDYFPDPDRELFALGISNVIGSLLGGFMVFGSSSRSRAQEAAGGRSMVTGVITAVIVVLGATLLPFMLMYIPKAVLAAIILHAAIRLVELFQIIHLFQMRNFWEISLFVISWVVTLFLDIVNVVFICLLISVLRALQHVTLVDLSLLGYITTPDNEIAYVDLADYENAQVVEGALLIGLNGPLRFYNSGQLKRTMEHLIGTELRRLSLSRASWDKAPKVLEKTLTAIKHSAEEEEEKLEHHYHEHAFVFIMDFSKCPGVVPFNLLISHNRTPLQSLLLKKSFQVSRTK